MIRPRVWHMLVLGPIVGLLSGTLSYWLQYWIDPTIVTRPIGQYVWVVLYNVLAWTSWLLFIPFIWRLASWVRIRRERFVPPTLFHAVASVVLAALVCVITGYEQYLVMKWSGITQAAGQPLTPAFNLKRVFLYTFEWKFLLYWGIVGVHHAVYYAHALGSASCTRTSSSTRCMRLPVCCTRTPTRPNRCWCGSATCCGRCSGATRSRRCRSGGRSS
jgi:hypothetical protein